jgi:catechol 2,3-dioxygenase-like lactoylglutathione lyase family enzyme
MTVHIHHVNIRTADLERTIAFYTEALGLTLGSRPDFNFGGAWLYDGAQPAVHLTQTSKPPPADDNAFDHVAFAFDALDPVLARLDGLKLGYSRPSPVPGTALRQCFLLDPNGIKVEIQGP